MGIGAIGWIVMNGLPSGSVRTDILIIPILIALVTLLTVGPLVWNYYLGKDPLEPVVIMGGLFFLYYPVNAFGITILNFGGVFPAFRNSSHLLGPFLHSLLLISGGVVAFYVGYEGVSKRGKHLLPQLNRRRLLVPNLLLVWLVSSSIYALSMIGVLSRSNEFVTLVARWHYFVPAAILFLYFQSERNGFQTIAMIGIIAIEILLFTVFSFKMGHLLIFSILLLLVYHYAGPGISYTHILGLGLALVASFPVSEIIERLHTGYPLSEAIFLPGSTIASYVRPFTGRLIGTEALTMIIARTPKQVPYQHGETLLLTVYSFVPRVIWSGKPSIIMCARNNQYFSGRGINAETCAAMTVPGELYWNFGGLGVLIGLFVLGISVGLLYRWFRMEMNGSSGIVPIILYGIALIYVMQFESGIAQMFSAMGKELLFALIFFAIVTENDGTGIFDRDGETTIQKSSIFAFTQYVHSRIWNWISYSASYSLFKRIFSTFLYIRDTKNIIKYEIVFSSRTISFFRSLFLICRTGFHTSKCYQALQTIYYYIRTSRTYKILLGP
ncbi:hypothetical protein [Halopenitus persicus]|uniref:hypothetical protein n=1 Tax=Halopenitus persicus TaxID=1048396 RepID=UPI00116063F3|nr:hypothetical protein [Halopenitus persicus]